jgi:hypothetical protein
MGRRGGGVEAGGVDDSAGECSTGMTACGTGCAGAELAKADPWSAWYSYDAARYLLLPVDFLSSPNLEKLRQEQALIMPIAAERVSAVAARWRSHLEDRGSGLRSSLHEADLGVVYQSTGVTDPAALRTEATARC